MLATLLLMSLAQYVDTTTDQSASGTKTWVGVAILKNYFSAEGALLWAGRYTSGFVQKDLIVGGAIRGMYDGAGLLFISRRGQLDVAADFVLMPSQRRDAGSILSAVDGDGAEFFSIGNNGQVVARCSNNTQSHDCGGFHDGSPSSGHIALSAYPGLYLTITGKLPLNYWGAHGAVTFQNSTPMSAGYIAEFDNGDTGTGADKKLMVNYQGGLSQFGGYGYNTNPRLAPCDGASDHPDNDGGAGYYVAIDAGQAAPGTQMWVVDLKRWCFCEPTSAPDGGPLAGWRRFDGQGCNVP